MNRITVERRMLVPLEISRACYRRANAETSGDWTAFYNRFHELMAWWIFRDAIAWLEARHEDFDTRLTVDLRYEIAYGLPTSATLSLVCDSDREAVLFKLACG